MKMYIWSDIAEVQSCEINYVNAWLKRWVFNLNRESVSEPWTVSGRLFQSLGAKCEKALPPLVDSAILGTTRSPEFCDLREHDGLCDTDNHQKVVVMRKSHDEPKLITSSF